jgi:DNA (cytosine-5)-methyltransferase 1
VSLLTIDDKERIVRSVNKHLSPNNAVLAWFFFTDKQGVVNIGFKDVQDGNYHEKPVFFFSRKQMFRGGDLKFLSLFSGIEAASVSFNPLGWKAAGFSEIDKFPCQLLAHHYPDIPNHGDVTLLPQKIIDGEVGAPELLVGGSPCQAFSVAGKRLSLDDLRGNLTLTYVEVANAIDSVRLTRGEQPSIVIWENVPGVLNTKDNAFGSFLAGLAGEDETLIPPGGKWTNAGCVFGPQRAIAWRVLDAQYFGVAQRRRRVFVVASAREGFDPTQVLFESEGERRDCPPSREQRQAIAANAVQGFTSVSFAGYSEGVCAARDYKDATDLVCVHGTQDPCTSDSTAFALGRNNGQENGLCYALQGNMIGRRDTAEPQGSGIGEEVCFTQTKTDIHAVCAFSAGQSAQAPTLRAGASGTNMTPTLHSDMSVRRLTPIECEKLQGFPPGYTDIKPNGKDTPDGPRYKALGNSWAVPVVRWIGERIQKSLEEGSKSHV